MASAWENAKINAGLSKAPAAASGGAWERAKQNIIYKTGEKAQSNSAPEPVSVDTTSGIYANEGRKAARRDEPTPVERVKNTLLGALGQSAGAYTNAIGTARQGNTAGKEMIQGRIDDLESSVAELEAALERQRAAGILSAKDIADYESEIANRKAQLGIYSTAKTVEDTAGEKTQYYADQMTAEGQARVKKAKEGLGKAGQLAVDVLAAGTQLGADIALGGGAATVPMAVRSFGGGAQTARQAGGTTAQQVGYGLASATVELLTERLFDGLAGAFGKGAADDVVEAVIGRLAKSNAGRTALRSAAGFLGEGSEEIISGAIDPLLQSIYNGKSIGENYSNAKLTDILYEGLIGGVLGGGGSAVSVATGQNKEKNAALKVQDALLEAAGIKQAENKAATETEAAGNESILPEQENGELESLTAENVLHAGARQETEGFDGGLAAGNDFRTASEEKSANTAGRADVFGDIIKKNAGLDVGELGEIIKSSPGIIWKNGSGIKLSKSEYAAVISRISTNYNNANTKHDGVQMVDRTTDGKDAKHYVYLYTDHGFGSYQIIGRLSYGRNSALISYLKEVVASDGNVDKTAEGVSEGVGELRNFYEHSDSGWVAYNDRTAYDGNEPTNSGSREVRSGNYRRVGRADIGGNDVRGDERVIPPGTGAVEKGGLGNFAAWQGETAQSAFHPISKEAQSNVVAMQGRAPSPIPKQIGDYLTRKGISTVINSAAIANDLASIFESNVAKGLYGYTSTSNQSDLAWAKEQVENSFASAMATYQNAVASGRTSSKLEALGIAIMQKASADGNYLDAIDAVRDFATSGTNTAQAMQARAMLNRLSPEGQLVVAYRAADKLQDENDARVETKRRTRRNWAELQTAAEITVAAREAAIIQAVNEFIAKQPYTAKEADFVGQAAEELVKGVNNRRFNRPYRGTPVGRTIAKDLNAFMRDLVIEGDKEKAPKRKAVNTLADYIANADEYERAWSLARDKFREEYESKGFTPESIRQFLQLSIDDSIKGGHSILLKAAAEEAAERQIKRKNIVISAHLGDIDDIISRISSAIIAESNAPAEYHAAIVEAVTDYVTDQAEQSRISGDKYVDAGIKATLKAGGKKLADIIRTGAKSRSALAQEVAETLVNQYGISAESSGAAAQVIIERFDALTKEKAQNALEQMFKERKPAVKKTVEQRLLELANLGAFTDSKFNEIATRRLFGLEDVSVNPELAQQLLAAQTEDERALIRTEIYKDLGRQVKSDWRAKFTAWRYTVMLGNPLTAIRNFLGNVAGIPPRLVKNIIATSGEELVSAISKATGKPIERQRAFLAAWNAEDRALVELAFKDWKYTGEDVMSGAKYNVSGRTGIDQGKRVFGDIWRSADNKDGAAKVAQKIAGFPGIGAEMVRKGVQIVMDEGDVILARPTYATHLAGWLKANGYTSADWDTMSESEKVKAREFAVNEAKRAIYRDETILSNFTTKFSSLGNKPGANALTKAAGVVVEGVMPFKSTPANLLVRAIEYSPVGILKAVKQAAVDVKRGNAKWSDVIDSFATSLSGTGIVLAGYFLAKAGLLTGGDDEDEKLQDLRDAQNWQEYSLYNEHSDTYFSVTSWLGPYGMLLAVGAEIYTAAQKQGASLEDVLEALKGIGEPMLEQSFLSGLDDALNAIAMNRDSRLTAFLEAAVASYVTQYVPALLGQAERISEDRRYQTYVNRDNGIPDTWEYTAAKLLNRIPGENTEYAQVEYRNIWGQPELTGTPMDRVLSNSLLPMYRSKDTRNELEKARDAELERLYSAGYTDVLMTRPSSNLRKSIPLSDEDKAAGIDSKSVQLSPEEFVRYQEVKGQTAADILAGFITTEQYKSLEDADREEYIDKVYRYATAQADDAVGRGNEAAAWLEAADEVEERLGIEPAEYLYLAQTKGSEFISTHIDDISDARKAGISLDDWERVYKQRAEINKASYGSGDKAAELAAWIDRQGFTEAQADLLKDQLKIYTTIPAEASSYERLRDAGLDADGAMAFYYTLKGVDDNSSIAQSDIAETIRQRNLSDAEAEKVWESYRTSHRWKDDWQTYKAKNK